MEIINQIRSAIEPLMPYLSILLPIVVATIVSASVVRSMRLYRAETKKPKMPKSLIRLYAGLISMIACSALWWMMNGKALDALSDGLIVGVMVGCATPFLWRGIVVLLRKYRPELAEKLHPAVEEILS